MTAAVSHPTVKASDRLGLTLFLALIAHAVAILGISFTVDKLKRQSPGPLSLEITLVHSASEKAPDDADYLAQSNQEGGGNVEDKVRATSPLPIPRPIAEQGDNVLNQEAASPRSQPKPRQQVMTTDRRSDFQAELNQPEPKPADQALPNAEELLERSREIARLSAEIAESQQSYSKMKKHKYISANTREYLYASYEESWRIKVERIGNLNYPDEAKRRGLYGTLLLDVAINADGSIHGIEVLRSSGQKAIDDGAIRIVRLAAPFSDFTPAMRKETDVLHIIRLWQFEDDSLHTSR